jgi:hypothetical protein
MGADEAANEHMNTCKCDQCKGKQKRSIRLTTTEKKALTWKLETLFRHYISVSLN